MKKILTLICLLVSAALEAKNANDSLLLKIDKRDQRIIGSKNEVNKSLREELEGAFAKKGISLSDSLWQEIRQLIKRDADGDSSLSVKIGNSLVKIGIVKSGMTLDSEKKSSNLKNPKDVQTDTLHKSIFKQREGKDEVHVGWDGIHVKDGDEEVLLKWKDGLEVKERNGEKTKVTWGKDSAKSTKKDAHLYARKGSLLNIGLNGINGKPEITQSGVTPPNLLSTDFDLKPINSAFVSLGINRSLNLVVGKKSAWRLGYGLNVDWYNFKFDHSRVIQQTASDQTVFQPIISRGQELVLKKNKLAVSYLTLPLMSQVVFRKESTIQMVAFGGYASYRLASWTKTIEEKSKDQNTEKSNFNLNQVRYGLKAEFAIRRFPDLFFNYDLTNLFQSETGLKMNGFSFGVKLL
jgi:hypothetical protein